MVSCVDNLGQAVQNHYEAGRSYPDVAFKECNVGSPSLAHRLCYFLM